MAIQTLPIFRNLIFLTLFYIKSSLVADILNSTQSITGNQTLVSAAGKFCLGFFSQGNSTNEYLGIWFNNIPNRTVVWVANRDNPLNQSTSILKFRDDGNLIILDVTQRTVWSSNTTNLPVSNTVAQLLDTGNLVLRDNRVENNETFIWQSFDYPTDYLLPGMKLGWDLEIGLNRYLTSWENADNPARGSSIYTFDRIGLPQFVCRGPHKMFRSGLWNGVQFSGILPVDNFVYVSKVVADSREVYYQYSLFQESIITMFRLSSSCRIQRYVWNSSSLDWLVTTTLPRDRCDNYNECGPNAICSISDQLTCSCLTGYKSNGSAGCIRIDPLNCSPGEGFIPVIDMKLPDLLKFRKSNNSMTLHECRSECLKNCSCTAYTNPDATGENPGCLLWFDDLNDIRRLQQTDSQIVYLRVSASDLPSNSDKTMKAKVAVPVSIVVLLIAFCIVWKRRKIVGMCSKGTPTTPTKECIEGKEEDNIELSIFSSATLDDATDSFSPSNKIGEGGFGPVYKGLLPNGQEIAVKRLALTSSGQGVIEFKNEITLIAKLQHRNLVRLLGCCIHGNERMLVYEYMPNGSLDSIFDGKDRNNFPMWTSRFNIIIGIARGLLYLHRDSRLRIIHRDLKASNVLLDSDLNPKISDFGTARAFGGEELLAKTVRVIGTYGYMSPEYAIHGIFSVKSDVFSFGVMVLEIVSGKRNIEFHHANHNLNLLGHAWRLWAEGKEYELVDPLLMDTPIISEVAKCVQVGLLCVQQKAEDRPEMSSVVSMLDGVNVTMPRPNEPGFFAERTPNILTERATGTIEFERTSSRNQLTNTLVAGR